MLNPSQIDLIHSDIAHALQEIASKHGLKVNQPRIFYSDHDFKLSAVFAECSVEDANPEYVRNLRKNGTMYGLSLESLGLTFPFGDAHVTFQGLRGKNAVLKTKAGKVVFKDALLVSQMLNYHAQANLP